MKKQKDEGRIRLQFDVGYKMCERKKMDGTVITVPDMSLTIRQLLEHHSRGVSSGVKVHEPQYFEEPIPLITDFTDVEAYRDELKKRYDAVNDQVKREQAEAKDRKRKEAEDKKSSAEFAAKEKGDQ